MDKQEYFVRIPVSVLMDKRLSRSAILLYAVLIDIADQYGIVYDITIDRLSSRTGLSDATIRRAERQLCEAELLTVSRTGRGSLLAIQKNGIKIQNFSAIDLYKKAASGGGKA